MSRTETKESKLHTKSCQILTLPGKERPHPFDEMSVAHSEVSRGVLPWLPFSLHSYLQNVPLYDGQLIGVACYKVVTDLGILLGRGGGTKRPEGDGES